MHAIVKLKWSWLPAVGVSRMYLSEQIVVLFQYSKWQVSMTKSRVHEHAFLYYQVGMLQTLHL